MQKPGLTVTVILQLIKNPRNNFRGFYVADMENKIINVQTRFYVLNQQVLIFI